MSFNRQDNFNHKDTKALRRTFSFEAEEKVVQMQGMSKSERWLWVLFFCGLIPVLGWLAYTTIISSLLATNIHEQIFFIVGFSTTYMTILFVYLSPAIVGIYKRNAAGIAVLNLYLGWTIIGWLAAFFWALMDKGREMD